MSGSLSQSGLMPTNMFLQSLNTNGGDAAKAFYGKLDMDSIVPANQAVTPVDGTSQDPVDVDPNAKKAAAFQKIIDALNNAKGGHAISDALHQLSDFIDDNTGASFADGVLDKIGGMVDKVLGGLGNDPHALNNVSFGFAANFSASSFSDSGYDMNASSFSFSFSLKTDDTAFTADLSFAEGSKTGVNSMAYASQEYAQVNVLSYNASVKDNPALQAFGDIAAQLTGVDPASLFGSNTKPEATPQAQAVSQIMNKLHDTFSSLSKNLASADDALKLLEDYLEQLKKNGMVDGPLKGASSATVDNVAPFTDETRAAA